MAYFYVPLTAPFFLWLVRRERRRWRRRRERRRRRGVGWLVGCWTGSSGLETDSLVFSNTNTGDIMAIT